MEVELKMDSVYLLGEWWITSFLVHFLLLNVDWKAVVEFNMFCFLVATFYDTFYVCIDMPGFVSVGWKFRSQPQEQEVSLVEGEKEKHMEKGCCQGAPWLSQRSSKVFAGVLAFYMLFQFGYV